jgi:predicted nucleotidyltransferase
MTKDFADFLDALNSEGVRYVVIGGMAVLSYLPYRTTRDIDVLIEATPENAAAARRAVRLWGDFEPEFGVEDFLSGDILSFGGLLRVEIHTNVPGVSWEIVWDRRVPGELSGVPTHFAALEDLIAMKGATGREEKDLPDLKRLKLLREKSADLED